VLSAPASAYFHPPKMKQRFTSHSSRKYG
jgi:hypothetical protein